MEIRQLRHFLAVVETGSLNRASESVHVSQQGLSASIKALEQSLNATLLERGRFGARPTVVGMALAEHARHILGRTRLARAELAALTAAETGIASLGAGPFFAQHLISDAIMMLMRERPKLSVRAIEADTGRIINLLLQGDIDFGVSTPSATLELNPDVSHRVLFEDDDVPLVAATHPLARAQAPTLEDLSRFPWIFSDRFHGERERVFEVFTEQGLAPPTRFVLTDSIAVLLDLLRRGEHIHVTGRSYPDRCFRDQSLIALDVPQFRRKRCGMLLMRREGAIPPASAALLRIVERLIAAEVT